MKSFLLIFLAAALTASPVAESNAAESRQDRIGLDQWTYIHADADRAPAFGKNFGDFGISFGDLDGDGKIDIASGAHFYRNPGGDMTQTPWPRVTLPKDPETGKGIDAGLLFSVKGSGPVRDILAEDLPNIVWLHAEDSEGKTWSAKVVAHMPPVRHGNGRMIRLANILNGTKRPQVLLSGGGGTFLMQIPDDPKAGDWPIMKITSTDKDEQKGIGLGDIDADGKLDLVLAKGVGLTQIEWWRNPGDGSTNWVRHPVGDTVNMSKMIEIADVNGDGRADVVATDSENKDSGLFWFEAPSDPLNGKWARHDIDHGYNGLDSLSVADLNHDGHPDIVIGETKDRLRLVIYENVGNGQSWKRHLVSEGKESHKGAQAIDLNHDGRLDLVSIGFFGYNDLHIWRNDNAASRSEPSVKN